MFEIHPVKKVSVVIPAYNEQESLPELIRRTTKACESLGKEYEILLIDDGSSDNSAHMLVEASQAENSHIVSILLNRNYGQHSAILAGFSHVTGDLIITLDADLQNPPNDYTDLVKPEWKDKYTSLNFGGGTGKTILASLLVRYRDDNGEYGISDEGWDFVKSWIQNGHMEVQGEDYVGNAISGTVPITEMWVSGVLQNQTERDYKFEIMVPEFGVQ